MKMFIISALIAVGAAARLEHLEQAARGGFGGATSNQYLPPFGGSSGGSHGGSNFGSNSGFGGNSGFGPSGHSGFGSNSASSRFGDATSNKYLPPFGGNSNSLGSGFNRPSAGGSQFGSATSNQYLPPNHGPSFGSAGTHSFGASAQAPSSQYGAPQGTFGHSAPSTFGQSGSHSGFGSNSGFGGSLGSQGAHSQFGHSGASQSGFGGFQRAQGSFGSQYRAQASQNYPQQSFDEETGYHY